MVTEGAVSSNYLGQTSGARADPEATCPIIRQVVSTLDGGLGQDVQRRQAARLRRE